MRTGIRDFQTAMKAEEQEQQQQQRNDSGMVIDSRVSEERIIED